MSLYRMVEWQESGPGHHVGERQALPAAEAGQAITAGLARGLTPVRLKVGVGACNRGETCGWPDAVAERLVSLDWAEPVPVRVPAGDHGVEDKAITRPPADRMVHRATVTKEGK